VSAVKSKLARRAAKSTARHTAHGTMSKLRREPLRAGTLLAIGGLVGLLVGRALG
jgi:hypothetical protein